MPSSGDQNPAQPDRPWRAIGRTLIVEVVVLMALAGAGLLYLDWSSETNMAEFIAASRISADPGSRSEAHIQAANSQPPCRRGD